MRILLLLLSILYFGGQESQALSKEIETVPYVDVERYMGKWYEIASIKKWFSIGCVGSTADYTLLDDGKVLVYNSCYQWSFNGRRRSAVGKATVVDKESNAKLSVKFSNNPFKGKYWVIELDEEDYQYAVVGHPNRQYGWILSRTPKMDQELLDELFRRLEEDHGYVLEWFSLTKQREVEEEK